MVFVNHNNANEIEELRERARIIFELHRQRPNQGQRRRREQMQRMQAQGIQRRNVGQHELVNGQFILARFDENEAAEQVRNLANIFDDVA